MADESSSPAKHVSIVKNGRTLYSREANQDTNEVQGSLLNSGMESESPPPEPAGVVKRAGRGQADLGVVSLVDLPPDWCGEGPRGACWAHELGVPGSSQLDTHNVEAYDRCEIDCSANHRLGATTTNGMDYVT
jgi:hypothetical protein